MRLDPESPEGKRYAAGARARRNVSVLRKVERGLRRVMFWHRLVSRGLR